MNSVIEFNQFEKSEISLGLVWPAGQARPRNQTVHSALITRLSQPRPGQATGQARPEKGGLLAPLVL